MVKRCADIKFLLAARVLDRVMRDFQPQATQGPKTTNIIIITSHHMEKTKASWSLYPRNNFIMQLYNTTLRFPIPIDATWDLLCNRTVILHLDGL